MSEVSAPSVRPKPVELCDVRIVVLVTRAVRLASFSRSSSSTVTVSDLSCLSRSTLTGTAVPGLVADHHRHQLIAPLNRLAVELDDHVAGLEAGLGRRAAAVHAADERAAALLQAELGERAQRHVRAR